MLKKGLGFFNRWKKRNLFNPLAIAPGKVRHWWDVTKVGPDVQYMMFDWIMYVADKGLLADHAGQGAIGYMPSHVIGNQNGKYCARFDGTDDALDDFLTNFAAVDTDVFFIVDNNGGKTDPQQMFSNTGLLPNRQFRIFNPSTIQVAGANDLGAPQNTESNTGFNIISLSVRSAVDAAIMVDGVWGSTTVHADNTHEYNTIGKRAGNNEAGKYDFYMAIVCDRLTGTEFTNMVNGLKTYFNHTF